MKDELVNRTFKPIAKGEGLFVGSSHRGPVVPLKIKMTFAAWITAFAMSTGCVTELQGEVSSLSEALEDEHDQARRELDNHGTGSQVHISPDGLTVTIGLHGDDIIDTESFRNGLINRDAMVIGTHGPSYDPAIITKLVTYIRTMPTQPDEIVLPVCQSCSPSFGLPPLAQVIADGTGVPTTGVTGNITIQPGRLVGLPDGSTHMTVDPPRDDGVIPFDEWRRRFQPGGTSDALPNPELDFMDHCLLTQADPSNPDTEFRRWGRGRVWCPDIADTARRAFIDGPGPSVIIETALNPILGSTTAELTAEAVDEISEHPEIIPSTMVALRHYGYRMRALGVHASRVVISVEGGMVVVAIGPSVAGIHGLYKVYLGRLEAEANREPELDSRVDEEEMEEPPPEPPLVISAGGDGSFRLE